MPRIKRRGLMIILSSPSGAGKTTISRSLVRDDKNLHLSVSHTTRPPRSGEIEGRDYYFITTPFFEEMVDQDSFLEHAHVFNHHYGTLRDPVEDSLRRGKDVLFDIDWQGTQQLKEKARSDVVSVFILPPRWEDLETRLLARGVDSSETIAFRMSKAKDEMKHWPEYDYVLINEDVEETTQKVHAIMESERLRRERQLGLSDFVRELCGDA